MLWSLVISRFQEGETMLQNLFGDLKKHPAPEDFHRQGSDGVLSLDPYPHMHFCH
jgi:hypothetical protein